MKAHCMSKIVADAVFHHGTIFLGFRPYLLDQKAAAFAIQGQRIVAIGSFEQVQATVDAEKVIDLHGAFVYPGWIDAHTHLMWLGMQLMRVNLVGAKNKAEVMERLHQSLAYGKPNAWIQGFGWDQNIWPSHEFPTAQDLDQHFPNQPVWLIRVDGHAGWANSAALHQAQVNRQTHDPEGGKLIRATANGAITGIFLDNAMKLVEQAIPQSDAAELEGALERAIHECLRFGVTSVHDAGTEWDTIALYRRFQAQHRPMVRIQAMIYGMKQENLLPEKLCQCPIHEPYVKVRAVKLFSDGALGSRGAALFEDYSDDPGNRGLLLLTEEELRKKIRQTKEAKLQICIHAIGDRSNHIILNILEQEMTASERRQLRPRIEHAQTLLQSDIPRFAQLGILASVQPTHAVADMLWAEQRLGPERVQRSYLLRKIQEQGTMLAGGSDVPIEPINPLRGIYAAITRCNEAGKPQGGWFPQEALSRSQALALFTWNAAYAGFAEQDQGTLEIGKWADFVVMDQDLQAVSADQILKTKVLQTYVGGELVYGNTML